MSVHRKYTFKNLMLFIVNLEGKKIKMPWALGGTQI